MKINLIFFLARFGFGGAGNSVFKLANSLNQKKFTISIICLGKCAYQKELSKKGIKVYMLKSTKLILTFFKLKKLVSNLVKKNTKNILVSNINYTNIFCSILFWNNKKLKLVGFERTPLKELELYFNFIDFFKKSILKVLLYFFYKRLDKIVCNSEYICRYLKNKYQYKSIAIHPPSIIKNKKSNKKYKLLNFKNKKINITTVCRLSKEKKIKDILLALYGIKDKNFLFHIVGEGPEKNKLINLAKTLGLIKKVRFYGFRKKISSVLSKSDLYINSSLFEGFPNSVVEAADSGVPIISSQSHGGINEILSYGKYGTLYNGDYLILRKKINDFLQNPRKFFWKAKLAKINVRKFNLQNHKNKFENLIKNL